MNFCKTLLLLICISCVIHQNDCGNKQQKSTEPPKPKIVITRERANEFLEAEFKCMNDNLQAQRKRSPEIFSKFTF
uniref:Uncharacterized protein n=1 Tax=Trichobilharzia regenti TaxID=157069 RepID=A0AA85J2B8_TRIRE|nr:unnamed protein product [Trichobilharzia regenti]